MTSSSAEGRGGVAARLAEIEERLARVESALRRLEAGEPSPAEESPAPAASREPEMAVPEWAGILSMVGRAFLALGGAFLIRAFSEEGGAPRLGGAAAGLVYAGVWLALADRDARRGRAASSLIHGLSAVVIAFPLLGEISARYRVLSPWAAGFAAAAAGAIFLFVAWRQPGSALAWVVTAADVLLLLALLISTASIAPVVSALLLLLAATIWLAYGRRWPGPRWMAAAAADLVVLLAVVLASRPGGPPEAYRDLTVRVAIALALALPLVCLPSFALRTLVRRREVTLFEATQSVAALLIGLGGAFRVAQSAGLDTSLLAAAFLFVGLSSYGVAFGFLERRGGAQRNFHFYSSLAIFVTLAGAALCLPNLAAVSLWSGMSVLAAHLGGRYERMTLRAHGALYAVAAAIASGLIGSSADAFLARAGEVWRRPGAAGLVALGGAAASYLALFIARKPGAPDWRRRLPAVTFAAVVLAGLGGLAVDAFAGPARTPFAGRAAELAAVRTGVLSAAALLLAAAGRRPKFWELRGFVYPILALGGAKLLLEDLPNGRPATLFAGFILYGTALFVAPRWLRAGRPAV